jgi:hypothetical protein
MTTPLLLVWLAACGTPDPSTAGSSVHRADRSVPQTIVVLSKDDGDLASQLVTQVGEAKALGLAPFVQVFGDWCASCRSLRGAMDDPRMKEAFVGTYIVQVDTKWFGTELQSGLWFPGPLTVPSFYELRDDATFGASLQGGDWGADVPENMAPALQSYFRAHGAVTP